LLLTEPELSQKTFLRSKLEMLRFLRHSQNLEYRPRRREPLLESSQSKTLKNISMSTKLPI